MAFRAPLLGYNTNVRHKGRLYHIQTEDSGVGHPHIITHLFADGGRIVGSKKTSYAEHLNAEGLQDTVKKLMQAQHKAMFIALRDGHFDDSGPSEIPSESTGTIQVGDALAAGGTPSAGTPAVGSAKLPASPSAGTPAIKGGAAVARPEEPRPAKKPDPSEVRPTPLYQSTLAAAPQPAVSVASLSSNAGRQSIFGSDMTSEKSLDEVILSYLATDDKEG